MVFKVSAAEEQTEECDVLGADHELSISEKLHHYYNNNHSAGVHAALRLFYHHRLHSHCFIWLVKRQPTTWILWYQVRPQTIMPPKSTKPTNDELLAQFDDLGIDTQKPSSEQTQNPSTAKDAPSVAEKDPLAELENLASQRPSTPRLSAEARRSKPSSGRPSEDKSAQQQQQHKPEDVAPPRVTVEDEHSSEKVPAAPKSAENPPQESSGGGWWGGLLSTASAAMKQAEAAVKEIQKNEEAQKWAEQVRGNVGALRDFGRCILYSPFNLFSKLDHLLYRDC